MTLFGRRFDPRREWGLEGLVVEANALLPQVLPDGGRLKEEVTPRLVRHYATEGLLDEPARLGREARYRLAHLLQLLLVRKLLAEGYGLRVIGGITRGKGEGELAELLTRPLALRVGPQAESNAAPSPAPNPAMEYLERLRGPAPAPSHPGPPPAPAPRAAPQRLQRVQVEPGLEVVAGEDFLPPKSKAEWQALLARLEAALKTLKPTR